MKYENVKKFRENYTKPFSDYGFLKEYQNPENKKENIYALGNIGTSLEESFGTSYLNITDMKESDFISGFDGLIKDMGDSIHFEDPNGKCVNSEEIIENKGEFT